jgi:hypothetical protein
MTIPDVIGLAGDTLLGDAALEVQHEEIGVANDLDEPRGEERVLGILSEALGAAALNTPPSSTKIPCKSPRWNLRTLRVLAPFAASGIRARV